MEEKENLLSEIKSVSSWRVQKAAAYPEDPDKDVASAEKLDKLYHHVAQLPDNHELFELSRRCNQRDAKSSEMSMETLLTEQKELIKDYGYQSESNPETFVGELTRKYKKFLGEAQGA